MSALASDRLVTETVHSARAEQRHRDVLVPLALQEARRLVLHPVFLVGYLWLLGLTVWMPTGDFGPGDAFGAIDTAPTFFAGVPAIVAGNLVASRDRRSRSGEMLGALPVSEHLRTAALCLAALAPASLALLHVLAVRAAYGAVDLFFFAPGPAHLLQAPVTVLGGALVGIMVARWAPWPGAVAVAVVALVAVNVWTSEGDRVDPSFGFMHSWAVWAPEGMWAGVQPGSPAWHVAYLLGLCGCAASAALLRTAPRALPVLAAGAVCAAVVVAGGMGQLP